jgi:hypothetical protein
LVYHYHQAMEVIIHDHRTHYCRSQTPSSLMGPDTNLGPPDQVDRDTIGLVTATRV